MHFFVVLLACKGVDRSTFCIVWSASTLHTKNVPRSTLLHADITNYKNMHSILKQTVTWRVAKNDVMIHVLLEWYVFWYDGLLKNKEQSSKLVRKPLTIWLLVEFVWRPSIHVYHVLSKYCVRAYYGIKFIIWDLAYISIIF